MSTVAEKMIQNMGKIGEALNELKKSGLPRRIVVMAVAQKTKLSEKTVESVLVAVEDLAVELKQEADREVERVTEFSEHY